MNSLPLLTESVSSPLKRRRGRPFGTTRPSKKLRLPVQDHAIFVDERKNLVVPQMPRPFGFDVFFNRFYHMVFLHENREQIINREIAMCLQNYRSFLISGAPGNGKTSMAEFLSYVNGLPYFYVTPSSFKSSLFGMSEKNIVDIVKKAEQYAPSILVFDELDLLFDKNVNDKSIYCCVLELLDQLSKSDKNVFVFGITSRLNKVDADLARRFSHKMAIKNPTTMDKIDFVQYTFPSFFQNHADKICEFIERNAGDWSFAQLKSFVSCKIGDNVFELDPNNFPDLANYFAAINQMPITF